MQAQFWLSSRSCSGFTGAAPHTCRVCSVSLVVFAVAQPLANRTAPQPARSFTGAAPHAAHLSLAQVEKLSGIPANIIDLLEVGIKPVDLGHLHQLAKAYGKAVKITLI